MDKKRVLIVDDNADQMLALTQALVNEGFAVLQALTGREGMLLAIRHEPDLIVVDRIMPGLSGLDMVKQIREKKWGATVPVLFLSNIPLSDDTRAELENMKAIGYIEKSEVALNEVVEKIKGALG